LNTLREVYKTQYLNAATKQYLNQIERINQVMLVAEEKIGKQRNVLRGYTVRLKSSDADVLTLKQKQVLERYGEMSKELAALEADIRKNDGLRIVQEKELKALETPPIERASVCIGVGVGAAVETPLLEKLPAGMVEESLERYPKVQEADLKIRRLEAQIEEYAKSIEGTNARLNQMKDSLKDARSNLEKVKAEVMPDVAKRFKNLLRLQRASALQQTNEKLSVANGLKDVLIGFVEKLSREAENIGTGSFEIQVQRSIMEQQEAFLKTLRAEKERLEIEKSNDRDTILGEQEAEVPTINQASLLKSSSLYALGGLVLGLLGVSYFEARLHRLHRPAQVEQELGIQILGILPNLAQKSAKPYGEVPLASESIQDVMFADAVNNLCARLLCDDRLTNSSVVMVTSATENEGKTMLATQLAAGLARVGRRTLLLDCDFRNARCHVQFGLPAGPGLGELLCGEAGLASVIQTVPESDLRIVTAGKSNSQAIKALNNGKFAALLAGFRKDYDYVIVDSAPTPVVSDGLLIGKLSDGVILVVRPKVSKAGEVVAAFEQMAALRIPVLGSVVNANLAAASGSYYK
jgi:polysaccharide biosynthesis transport protein